MFISITEILCDYVQNMIDASIAAICFWLLGYGFAYGTDKGYGFIGSDNFATEVWTASVAFLRVLLCGRDGPD